MQREYGESWPGDAAEAMEGPRMQNILANDAKEISEQWLKNKFGQN
jgi:hypothetical protein